MPQKGTTKPENCFVSFIVSVETADLLFFCKIYLFITRLIITHKSYEG